MGKEMGKGNASAPMLCYAMLTPPPQMYTPGYRFRQNAQ